jgi:Tfp pilus assembly protein PilW
VSETAPARTRLSGEDGTTVAELMVSLLILSLVLATVFSSLWSAGDTLRGTDQKLQNLEEARSLIAVASKDVRTAVRLTAASSPFLVADKREAVFYANLDTTGAPKKVRIYVDGSDQLVEQVWTPDAGSTAPNYTYTGAPAVRYVGRYVANPTNQPIFTYLDNDNAALTSTPLSASDRLSIKAVRLTLIVKRTSAFNDKTTTIVNRVRLPNLDYNAVAG